MSRKAQHQIQKQIVYNKIIDCVMSVIRLSKDLPGINLVDEAFANKCLSEYRKEIKALTSLIDLYLSIDKDTRIFNHRLKNG